MHVRNQLVTLGVFFIDFEASPHKANADPETAAKSNRRKRVSAKRVPDPSQNPRKVMALGADVSGLGTPAAGRVGLRRKVRSCWHSIHWFES